jgi:hypothetical protein
MAADDATYQAVRRVHRTHLAYTRRGEARRHPDSGVGAEAERAAEDLGSVLESRRQQLFDALVAARAMPLGDALDAVAQVASRDPRLMWRLHTFLRSVQERHRPLRSARTAGGPAAGTAPANLFRDHVAEVCQNYRDAVEATAKRGGGRRRKKAARREAEEVLSRNLCAFQLLVHATRDDRHGPELAAAAAAALA